MAILVSQVRQHSILYSLSMEPLLFVPRRSGILQLFTAHGSGVYFLISSLSRSTIVLSSATSSRRRATSGADPAPLRRTRRHHWRGQRPLRPLARRGGAPSDARARPLFGQFHCQRAVVSAAPSPSGRPQPTGPTKRYMRSAAIAPGVCGPRNISVGHGRAVVPGSVSEPLFREIVGIAHHAPRSAPTVGHQFAFLERVERALRLVSADAHHRVAARLLVAAARFRRRLQRKGVVVRCGVLLFRPRAEHAYFEGREQRENRHDQRLSVETRGAPRVPARRQSERGAVPGPHSGNNNREES